MRLPEFITFTGADDETSVEGMVALAARYPIEWGILFAPKRQGLDPRYPSEPLRFLGCGLRLAAHLCGAHSRAIMDALSPAPHVVAGLRGFERVQVNHVAPDAWAIRSFQAEIERPCIAQARGLRFPADDSFEWLFDASGGRGVSPTAWPRHPGHLVGYAGGLGPENVRAALERIGATGPYWIDMESGVRTDDRFDLGKCRAVCEAVYGARASVEAPISTRPHDPGPPHPVGITADATVTPGTEALRETPSISSTNGERS